MDESLRMPSSPALLGRSIPDKLEELNSNPSENMESGDLNDQLIGRMYELYGLDNIDDISFGTFALLESSLNAVANSTPSPNSWKSEDIKQNQDILPKALDDVHKKRPQSSSGPVPRLFADPTSQLPDQLMYTPVQYQQSNLPFPDYMMVHSQSGLPVLFNDQPSSITSDMAYGACVCYYQTENGYTDSPAELPFHASQAPLLYETLTDTSHFQYAHYECTPSIASSVSIPHHQTNRPARYKPRKVQAPPRKRGRPKKHVSPPVLTSDFRPDRPGKSFPLEEKENIAGHGREEDDESVGSGDLAGAEDDDDEEETEEPIRYDDSIQHCRPKPPYSYSALVTLALKNSKTGRMTVRDIYNFMCSHFPYFRTAPSGWKNSVRHNLSLNPAFLKIVAETGPAKARTPCRWTMNPERYWKMNEEIAKFRVKALNQIVDSMRDSDLLTDIEDGTYSDFYRAVRGVCIQEKKIGQRRRKLSTKKSASGMPKDRKKSSSGKKSSRNTVYQPAHERATQPALLTPFKPRSPLSDHTATSVRENYLAYSARLVMVPYSKISRSLENDWDGSDEPAPADASENCQPNLDV